MNFTVSNYLKQLSKLTENINVAEVDSAIATITQAYNDNRKIFTCGNGGSATTASHYITDWNKMTNLATGKKFRGISLCDNVGLITAYANDISYTEVFSGQLKTTMDPGDLLIVISGSGNSKNAIAAVNTAHQIGGESIAIVGYDGGILKTIASQSVHIPSFDMQLCEDLHLTFGHLVMKSLCGSSIN
jgi:D-sedoheptulose 7-phosphate isomerase